MRSKRKNPSLLASISRGTKRRVTESENADPSTNDAEPEEATCFELPDLPLDDFVPPPTDEEDHPIVDYNEEQMEEEGSVVDPDTPIYCPATKVEKKEDIGVGCRGHNGAYFFHENKKEGDGLKYMVGMSNFQLPNLAPDLDHEEVMMYAQTAQLASDLTRPQRDRLANLTSTIVDITTKQTIEQMEVLSGKRERRAFMIKPLITPNLIRMNLFESTTALFNIMPHPPLFKCRDHAYTLYSDICQDALGKGYDLDYIPIPTEGGSPLEYPLRDITSTRQCKTLFNINDHMNGDLPLHFVDLWLIEWSDDADPNSSIKNNRGSMWFKSCTVSPTRDMIHSLSHTYPLAMGHKNADHEHVGRLLKEDLVRLGAKEGIPMYSKKHGGIVLVRARLFACLQDQPERRGENYLMAGNSDLHRRFGYSFPWHKFKDVLRPCVNCRALLLDESLPWECPDCDDCTNFALHNTHPLLAYDAPEYFPFPLKEGERLQPMALTYSSLVAAVTLSHEALVEGWWCVEEAAEWLQLHCINQKAQDSILQHAERCKEFREIMEDPDSTVAEKAAVAAEKEREPNLYQPWPIPSLWTRGVLLNQSPDVPMHLLFLGCVKTVMLRVQAWMSNKRKASPFAREMKQYMESLEGIKLTWIKILPYKGGKFGGWVSENYLAMSCIMKWFYSLLDRLASDKEPWVEPVNKPQKNWTAVDNRTWLSQRGLNKDGLANIVSERVNYYMTQVDPVPPVIEMLAGPVDIVLSTISSMDELISLVMIEAIPNEEYYSSLERKIRIFLTHFADMEDKLPSKKKLPQWLSAYNFMSLLNLPDVIRQYGPVRNIWEGGAKGEGVLRFVKPNMLNGMRRSWEMSSMKTLMRKKAMEYVVDQKVGTASSRVDAQTYTKSYHAYSTTIYAVDELLRNNKKFISCINLEDGRWGVVWKSNSVQYFLPLTRSAVVHTLFAGHRYFVWERDLAGELELLDPLPINVAGILLPLLQYNLNLGDVGFSTNCYALVSEDHRVLGDDGYLAFL